MPAVDADRRGGLFVYFLAYISSGMGLLLATSFFNLRRYFAAQAQDAGRDDSDVAVDRGAVVIICLTVLAAALPLPGTGWSVVRGSTSASGDHSASSVAVLKDGGVKGEGAAGEKNDPNAKQETSGKGKEGGKSGPGNAKSGAATGKASKVRSGRQEGLRPNKIRPAIRRDGRPADKKADRAPRQ